MSAISSLGTSGTTAPTTDAYGSLKSSDFIKVMLSELRNQDPFQPQDSSKLLEQLSSLRNIESQTSLQTQLQNLVLQSQISQAGGLIGKVVAGLDANNDTIGGQVTSVVIQDGKALLELDTGKTLGMDRVTQIAQGAATP
ncbi:MAG: hypothetical protein K8S99_17165 [Planctomycetes bacterium]|nr:hypothetical protein [Planctomycetota bacterium]